MKKLLITIAAVAMTSTAVMAADCTKPKYIAHSEAHNDFGGKLISGAFLPLTATLGVAVKAMGGVADVVGADKFASGTRKGLCAAESQIKHLTNQ